MQNSFRFILSRSLVALWGLVALSLALASPCSSSAQGRLPYQNAKLPVEERVRDLLGRMTLEEKIAQLQSRWENTEYVKNQAQLFVNPSGEFVPEKAEITLKNGVGEVSVPSENRGPRKMAEFTNVVQSWVIRNTRLGIPVLFHDECLHGHLAPGGTNYPVPIALASTWDPDLVFNIFTSVAREVRVRGAQQCLAPVLDLARDPRWGRTEETYGEDPFLVSRMGGAAIHGLQGDGPEIGKSHVLATAKHFAVHGQPEGGTNMAPGNYSERVIRESFFKPFESAVKEGNVQSVMASYNEIDGIPSHANQHLLTDILRNEWKFNGIVVSDYFGVAFLNSLHHVAESDADAARQAIEAGVDVELPFGDAYTNLAELVRTNKIAEALIDRSVARILREKFLLGLFEDPYVDAGIAESSTNSEAAQELALKAAHEAIILLKNGNGLLPLDKAKYRRLAVVGPNASDVHLGTYSDHPGRGVSILQGIKDKVGSANEVTYAEGCRITESKPDWNANEVIPPNPQLDQERIKLAFDISLRADVVVLVLGENEQTSRESGPEHPGDRDSLDLIGRQEDLFKALQHTGKPIVVILLHGRPNSINYLAENADAILDGWYLGQEGGTAMADVLFGDYNPGGKLPITVPRSVGQLPDYYYQKPSAKRGSYLFTKTDPLFVFGHGLSYTKFTYSHPTVSPQRIDYSQRAKLRVSVTNAGTRSGDEVVQLYIHHVVSSVTQPIKELRAFQRVNLQPGERKTIEFEIKPEMLSLLDKNMKPTIETGRVELMVGGNSADLLVVPLDVLDSAR
jgi:beta-glucosidase